MTLQALSLSTFRDALADSILDGLVDEVRIHPDFVHHLTDRSRVLLEQTARNPDSQRKAVIQVVTVILIDTPRFIPGPSSACIALAIVRSWLSDSAYQIFADVEEVD